MGLSVRAKHYISCLSEAAWDCIWLRRSCHYRSRVNLRNILICTADKSLPARQQALLCCSTQGAAQPCRGWHEAGGATSTAAARQPGVYLNFTQVLQPQYRGLLPVSGLHVPTSAGRSAGAPGDVALPREVSHRHPPDHTEHERLLPPHRKKKRNKTHSGGLVN